MEWFSKKIFYLAHVARADGLIEIHLGRQRRAEKLIFPVQEFLI